jgi:predicted nuclease of predicted toxin-antitoxin system
MKIKVDEDLPRIALHVLQEARHEAQSVIDQHMGGCSDTELWNSVQAEQRFLITADKGFGDIRSYSPGTHGGVLVLRPNEDGIRPLIDLLERVLANYELTSVVGTVTIACPSSIRIRRTGI